MLQNGSSRNVPPLVLSGLIHFVLLFIKSVNAYNLCGEIGGTFGKGRASSLQLLHKFRICRREFLSAKHIFLLHLSGVHICVNDAAGNGVYRNAACASSFASFVRPWSPDLKRNKRLHRKRPPPHGRNIDDFPAFFRWYHRGIASPAAVKCRRKVCVDQIFPFRVGRSLISRNGNSGIVDEDINTLADFLFAKIYADNVGIAYIARAVQPPPEARISCSVSASCSTEFLQFINTW